MASDLMAAPTNTPCCQLKASYTSGTPEIAEPQVSQRYLSLPLSPSRHSLQLAGYPGSSCSPSGRRPPKIMASMGTPSGDSHSGSIMGHWPAGVQKRELGWAQGSPREWKSLVPHSTKGNLFWFSGKTDWSKNRKNNFPPLQFPLIITIWVF